MQNFTIYAAQQTRYYRHRYLIEDAKIHSFQPEPGIKISGV